MRKVQTTWAALRIVISRRLFSCLAQPFILLTAILVLSFVGASATQAPSAPSLFSAIDAPSGVAASQQKLLVTERCGDYRHILSIDESGETSLFAKLPSTGGGCSESDIAISPGLGGFLPNYIYVTYGNKVLQVTPDGKTVKLFATLPSLPSAHGGIAFDVLGTFANAMVINMSDGQIFTVNSVGQVKFLASLARSSGKPSFAPTSFSGFAGDIFVAGGRSNTISAINAAGHAEQLAEWRSAESIQSIPDNNCTYSGTNLSYFQAVSLPAATSGLFAFDRKTFDGLNGDALISGKEASGFAIVVPASSSSGSDDATMRTAAATLPWKRLHGTLMGGSFIDCSVPRELAGEFRTDMNTEEEDAKTGDLVLFSSQYFDVSTVLPSSVHIAGSEDDSAVSKCRLSDVNADGLPDLVCTARTSDFDVANKNAITIVARTSNGVRVSSFIRLSSK